MRLRKIRLLLTITALLMLSAMSYAQGSQTGASPSKTNPVTFEDAFTLTLDKLDAAEEYIKKIEIEKGISDGRLALEKERSGLLVDRIAAKDAQLAANEREKAAGAVIEAEDKKQLAAKDTQLKAQADRIGFLEKRQKGGFFKGFAVGFGTGVAVRTLLKFLM